MFNKNGFTKKIAKQIKYDFNTKKNRFKNCPIQSRKFNTVLYDKSKLPKARSNYKSDMYLLNKNEFYKTRKQPKICFIKNKKLLKRYKSFTPCSFDKPYKNYKEEDIINNAKTSQTCENIINKNLLDVEKEMDEVPTDNLYNEEKVNLEML